WYGINTTKFTTYLEDIHATFPDKPIWLTEFACHNFQDGGEQCTYPDAVAFMNATQAWLDKQDYIHRYAWFGAMKDPVINPVNALMDQNGIINDLGKQYIHLFQLRYYHSPLRPPPSMSIVPCHDGAGTVTSFVTIEVSSRRT
ncbi:hypothetical protein FS749_014751, partial [Ceratobasidium sp. UAMH 11750]